MDKRYQVFVSSTYVDLKEERQHVVQTLMEMDCIPAGMELFPAVDEEQWEFIKKIIDDCDYYLLIIGGRYGSITEDGISYTEKEFDYAVDCDLKVIALIHGAPEEISLKKSEGEPELRAKLESFKTKVREGRLVKEWTAIGELPGLVALSLTKTIKTYPAVGWVRADKVANEDMLSDMNELRERNAELEKSLFKTKGQQQAAIDDIADIDSKFTIHGEFKRKQPGRISHYTSEFRSENSWREIFSLIAPYLVSHPSDELVKQKLASALFDISGEEGISPQINDQEFKTVSIQLGAYNLIETQYSKTTKGGMNLFWALTEKGNQMMIESRIVRKSE